MIDPIVNQPLVQITVFQCPQCSRTIRNDRDHEPYACPWGCGSRLIVLRTEWEERASQVSDPPVEPT
jgi:DNA-directed RNA polymerase subunit RPC12/RpoP